MINSKALKLFCLVLFSVLLISGCRGNNGSQPAVSSNSGSALTIAASFYPMYLFALNIAQDVPDVNVICMTEQTVGCLHDYALKPEDLQRLEGANILITNGAGLESFMNNITSQMPNLKIIEAGKSAELIQNDSDEKDDPHVWLSISSAITQVQTIGEQLALLDPPNAARYKENTDTYIAKLDAQKTKMSQVLAGFKDHPIILFDSAFLYFVRDFNFNMVASLEREPGSTPSASELSDTVNMVKGLNITALFAEPEFPSKTADAITVESGAKVRTLDPIVSGPLEADAYIKLMDSNLQTFQEAFQ